jgi:hypothetical protein
VVIGGFGKRGPGSKGGDKEDGLIQKYELSPISRE